MAHANDGWIIERALESDCDELMTWFDNARSVKVWGGPRFRYPFTRRTFRKDCHWDDMATFCLRDPDGRFAAFGQIYERLERINLARLVAHPEMRGRGVGKRLVTALLELGAELYAADEFSLFVYRDNAPALACYQSLGFRIQEFPPGARLADECYYLTRPVTAGSP
jgi:ribosomal protein S18 acetylase RimI-like enzyme